MKYIKIETNEILVTMKMTYVGRSKALVVRASLVGVRGAVGVGNIRRQRSHVYSALHRLVGSTASASVIAGVVAAVHESLLSKLPSIVSRGGGNRAIGTNLGPQEVGALNKIKENEKKSHKY